MQTLYITLKIIEFRKMRTLSRDASLSSEWKGVGINPIAKFGRRMGWEIGLWCCPVQARSNSSLRVQVQTTDFSHCWQNASLSECHKLDDMWFNVAVAPDKISKNILSQSSPIDNYSHLSMMSIQMRLLTKIGSRKLKSFLIQSKRPTINDQFDSELFKLF